MRTIKKRHLAILALAFAIAGAGIGATYAADDAGKTNQMSTLVAAIAEKFNLDKNEVQEVFDEQKKVMETQRQEKMAIMQEKREQEFTNRLEQAVEDGGLTQEQANLILKKRVQISEELEENKPVGFLEAKQMTEEERQARRQKMEAKIQELNIWAEENNIPEEYLPLLRSCCGREGHGREFGETPPDAE